MTMFKLPRVIHTRRLLTAAFITLACFPAFATTFTNNTSIGVGNTNYDGTDIIVSNCTVTVDGPHLFASLHLAAGGVLTHSYVPGGGALSNILVVTNEPQVLTGTNAVTLDNSNIIIATVSVTDLTGTNFYTNGLDYLLSSPDGIMTDLQLTTNSSIPDGATVLVDYQVLLEASPPGLTFTVTSNVVVDAGGAINADGIGFGGGFGPGAGRSSTGYVADGSGGGYGGIGGTSSSNALGGTTYGSFYSPASLGSGGGASYGGNGGAGGGLIGIVAGGSVVVNGSISANGGNGTNNRSGGGSGGSILITGATFSGTGAITAKGGSGEPTHGGGGGGGRIAVQYGTTSFAGSMAAYGGAGSTIGGAGTVYTKTTGQNGLLLVDNGGQSGTNTLLAVADNTVNVLIQGRAGVLPTVPWTMGNLTIASNGLLLASALNTLTLTSAGAITVEAGGRILADGAGYAPGIGVGAGRSYPVSPNYPCGGGGYGGNGASGSITNATGGESFGSQATPGGPGSGGASYSPYSIGGNGGGAIQITSQNGVVQVDGTISAGGGNGTGAGGGGGSGGTIVLTGGTLLGFGSITANGGSGAGSVGGGGGGGRIEIAPTSSLFDGTVSAYGGGGGNWGGAGTILIQASKQNTQLILDNGGHAGTNTPVQSASSTDLIVQNGATGTPLTTPPTPVTFANLYLNANGWLAPPTSTTPQNSIMNFSFTGSATIEAGGGIVANFAGNSSGQGYGPGRTAGLGSTNVGSGAGHGGSGGASAGNAAAGGSTYDTPFAPTLAGSGGGGYSTVSVGGSGGGIIRLSVTGTLEMDGVITANGGNGSGTGAGGGAGGAIWISAGTVSGGGSIAANGGSGSDSLGGGGGGGMIYISCNNNSFSGPLAAYGGGGANWGGTGTTTVQASQGNAQFILDNGGNSGPPTPLPTSGTFDVTLRNGAMATFTYSPSIGNLIIGSNAWLMSSNAGSYSTITCSSATIQAGGGILEDAMGYSAGSGTGAGHYSSASPNDPCGGGGHGGIGASSAGGIASGGNAYDTTSSPSYLGSGGGSASSSSGGAGGGGLRLNVTGALQVDGTISANGGNGGGTGGGGGSGGSLYLNAASLSGGGLISANGGSGANSVGGGGGGGCIAIYATANQFAGAMTAYGGGGANWGGAGTIYVGGQIIIDNNGQPGAITPIQGSSSTGIILRNGAMGSGGMYGLSAGNLLVGSNSSLVVSNGGYQSLMCSTATIQAGGSIIADFQGYAGGTGYNNGAGHSYSQAPDYPCGGAGHGGNGANCSGNVALGGSAYDSQTSPSSAGSGGGTSGTSSGGAGGGVISLTVTGLLQVDGVISANGGNGSGTGGGGGAGGSIRLTAGTLAGAGLIRANGGSGVDSIGGGGAGGIIAILPTANSFAGVISAYGGGGANWGGAGSIYIAPSGQNPQLTFDNGGQSGATTPIQSVSSSTALTLRNGATGLTGASLTLGSVLVSSNAWLLVSNSFALSTLTLSTATIQAGGGIIADFQGYAGGSGSGAGRNYGSGPVYCSGAGHGGLGGNSSGNLSLGGGAYDTQTSPSSAGSGGGTYSPSSLGGSGGGALGISVSGLLQVDGVISANGGNGSGSGGGGGSGGSIKLTAGTLAGVGTIRANGGNGVDSVGGGGGGGCIAIYPTVNAFAGVISAYGGSGANWGGAGTIYLSGAYPQFTLDNGGQSGAATPIQSLSTSSTVIVRNGAVAYQQFPPQTFASLTISSNAWLEAIPTAGNNYPGIVNVTLTGNATIQAGGGIVTDGAGSAGGTGAGGGRAYVVSPYYPCSGGGYGGNGAGITGTSATGGLAYGSTTSPTSNGSGGGNDSPSIGGAGGGSIKLTVNGALDVDGKISANGGNGTGTGGGGGSGGSVWLIPGTLVGAGSISANGGNGVGSIGGGGGGGRIAITYTANNFAGQITAHGGGGGAYGGGGTIYTKANSQSTGQILVDNGGEIGAGTPLSGSLGVPSTAFNLVIQNGGATIAGTSTFPLLNNLTIASGGVLNGPASQSTFDLLVLNDLNVAPGGAIAVDGEGYPQAAGTGAGQSLNFIGSGAGYGGAGGASSVLPGGATYGSASQPVDFGSGGGLGDGPPGGGSAGGGVLRLNVGSVLSVDGQITAEGQAGVQDDSGGGSGGSIWVTAGTLAGNGRIGADGGDGELYYGGGGGGGRVALYNHANIFSGITSAIGGDGYAAGASGTVVNSNNVPALQVLSNSPSGVVSNAVSSLVLYFNGAPNPNAVSSSTVILTAPNGPVPSGSVSITMLSSARYLVSFPMQTAVGAYSILVTNVYDLYGYPLAQAYTGSFTVSLPVIQGTITDTNGQPVAGVLLQPSGGLSTTTTDTNGNYALGFPQGSTFKVTPSLNALMFAPSSMSYANVTNTITGQNYIAVPTIAATLATGYDGTNFILNWPAITGVNYQILTSTDLVNWVIYNAPITASNGPVQILVPATNQSQQFFQVQSSN